MDPTLKAREIKKKDIPSLLDYWYEASPEYMQQMGADKTKLPLKKDFELILAGQLKAPYSEKKALATIWFVNGQAVGHCNVNQIIFGEQAHMHLHLWYPLRRRKGLGRQLVLLSLPHFFEKLQLKKLFCEPYALNPAPNKTLEKLGFTFVKTYRTVPGSLNFEQDVNQWVLTRDDFESLVSV